MLRKRQSRAVISINKNKRPDIQFGRRVSYCFDSFESQKQG